MAVDHAFFAHVQARLPRTSRLLQASAALCMSLMACQPRAQRKPAAEQPTWPQLNEKLLVSAAETGNYRFGRSVPLAVTKDGSVLFRRTPARARRADLFEIDANGNVQTLIAIDQVLTTGDEQLSAEERARRERSRTQTSGVVDVSVSTSGTRVLVPIGARLFLLERASGKVRELQPGPGFPFDPQLSPDGKFVAFVRDADLWLLEVDSKAAARKLTHHEPDLEYGSAEFVAQEELDRKSGYVWAPDSQSIAFQRTDAREVDTLYVSDPRHPEEKPTPFKYPRAGRPNAKIDLGIIPIRAGAQPRWVKWDPGLPYLAKLLWPQNAPLQVLALSRAQTDQALIAIDPNTGTTTELLREHDDTWLNLTPGSPSWMPDGSGFLWLHEADEGYALEQRTNSGALTRTLTQGSFGARSIAGVAADAAIITASQDPREQHIFRVALQGDAAPLRLTAAGGVHTAIAAHGVAVISSEPREGGFRCEAVHNDGRRHQLPQLVEKPELTPTTQLESVSTDPDLPPLYTSITRPRDFDPKRRYPVLLRVYAGPHAQLVLDTKNAYLLDQIYADAGFVVLRIDGRGTPNRGRNFERAILKDLISVALADQAQGLHALLARHPELDSTRVGIFGWSFGGYFSTMALLLRPDLFHAGVAGAPVTDWALYDTAYTERYMRTPQENPEGYAHASALTHAAKLSRPLLLIHGVTDDNVHFAHALALIEALYAQSKAIEVVALASTHMVVDPRQSVAREKLQVEFFRERLGIPNQ
ncbi:MAG TPA: DPP IV N-terminal domain-containing protein [Polyangiales bacterium]|nr:DPP IV N-terminal domain-containing protein [Polyangiales bacterium]